MNRRGFLALLSSAAIGLTIKSFVPDVDVSPIVRAFEGEYQPAQLLWTPDDPAIVELPEVVARASALSMKGMTREILREMVRRLPPGWKAEMALPGPAYRVGDTVLLPPAYPTFRPGDFDQDITMSLRTAMLTQQFVVAQDVTRRMALSPDAADPAFVEMSIIRPTAAKLVDVIRGAGLNVFADLAMPTGVDEVAIVRDTKSGLVLRGIRAFESYEGLYLTRYDILGGRV